MRICASYNRPQKRVKRKTLFLSAEVRYTLCMRAVYERTKLFLKKYERIISPLAFLIGFIVDSLTLTRIDQLFDNAILSSYILIAALSIIVANAYDSGKMRNWLMNHIAPFLPLVIQFAFGGLFSGFLVFYSRSSSFTASWPFIAILLLLILGNETLKARYLRLTFQISIFFIVAFSYFIFLVPVLLKSMGDDIFIFSGFISLLTVWLLIRILRRVAFSRYEESRTILKSSILTIYVAFHVLYFTNIIPPLPLSLKEIGIYHSVARQNGNYLLSFEPAPWYEFRETSGIFHVQNNGGRVYAFSSVFAPAQLSTTISHRWQKFDEKTSLWVTMSRVPFPISGGRDNGFRGYTIKENVTPGKWRVDVVTAREQVIGRFSFTVLPEATTPLLETSVK